MQRQSSATGVLIKNFGRLQFVFVSGSTRLRAVLILLSDPVTRFHGYRRLVGSALGTQSCGLSGDALPPVKTEIRSYVQKAFLCLYDSQTCHAKSIKSVANS